MTALLTCLLGSGVEAADKDKENGGDRKEMATRLQVFLDRAEFAPGKIDGRYGEFTLRALALYRQAQGAEVAKDSVKKSREERDPDVSGLDLSGVEPVFIDYKVTEGDGQAVGTMADQVEEQARQESMPYRSLAEAVAEKFHCDQKFLVELNPGKMEELKTGQILKVPNVEPFDLSALKSMKPGVELKKLAANDIEKDKDDGEGEGGGKDKKEGGSATVNVQVTVDIKTEMVSVLADGKLVAVYPVTVGSQHTESPVGEWKVRGFEKMPRFRYDVSMLEKGERSSDFKVLPSGPNSPVGVLWIALNKKGIGLHGTSEPDSIGRSVSHGCIRLANWDVARLARKLKIGVPVLIR